MEYLETATLRYNAVVHVYCLMNNHYHILLETPSGNLPQIMRHINGAYTTYFNLKHSRSGTYESVSNIAESLGIKKIFSFDARKDEDLEAFSGSSFGKSKRIRVNGISPVFGPTCSL
ncbi:MAG: transposase, partial [Desulfosarcina sp.]|nr:transposase [Desulfobacterales bacterium]